MSNPEYPRDPSTLAQELPTAQEKLQKITSQKGIGRKNLKEENNRNKC